MSINSNTFLRDLLSFIKKDLLENITDPLSLEKNKRSSDSSFIMTSYPQRLVQYPIITIKVPNIRALRAGMQTTAMDIFFTMEVRIWARNQKEKDDLFAKVLNRLKDIQFTIDGTVVEGAHDFNLLSSVEVDEEGEKAPKSRIMQLSYKYYNV